MGLRARLNRIEGHAHATMNDAQALLYFCKEVVAGLQEDYDDKKQLGRDLGEISEGFIAHWKEKAEKEGDPQQIIPAVVTLVRAVMSQVSE